MAADGSLPPRRATLAALAGVLLGVLLAALNQTVVATALPAVVEDLGGMEHYTWVFAGYLVALTVTGPLHGRLSDVHGRRPVFVAGLVVFMLGALVGAAAQSMTVLVLARIVQGIGAGALIPIAMAVVGDLVPPAQRGRWLGVTSAVIGVGATVGPVAGGLIADHLSWRWVFLVSLPVGVVALAVVLVTLRLPRAGGTAREVDYVGASLLTGGLSALLVVLTVGGWSSPRGPVLLATGVALLAAYAHRERAAAHPTVPLGLLRDRTFSCAAGAALAAGAAMFGTVMAAPLFVQDALGASATSAGLVTMPLMVAMFGASFVSGQVVTHTGRYRWALLGAPGPLLAGFGLLASLDRGSPSAPMATAMALVGLGLGVLMPTLVLAVQNVAPAPVMGAATAASQFFRNAGGAVGVSVMGALLAAHPAPADALHVAFLLGLPLTALIWAAAAAIPETPLRQTLGDPEPLSG